MGKRKMQTTIDNEFIAKRKDSKGRVFLGAGTFYLSPDADLTHISLIGVGKEDTCMFMPRAKFREQKPLNNLDIKGNL